LEPFVEREIEMPIIQTVLGPIQAENLGTTYSHDHLLFCPPAPFRDQDPDLRLDSQEAAIQELQYFRQAGGRALVEMTTMEMGRDPLGLQAISLASGVHIIAATGYNKDKFCKSFVAEKAIEQIAADEVQDLLGGMDGSRVRAGLIKASSSQGEMTPAERKVFSAAQLAHKATGAPISTHTEAGTLALEQAGLLIEGGVSAEHIIIGHVDRKLEWDDVLALAETGVYMGFDQISKEKYYSDQERIRFIQRLVERGHSRQILLSGDLARKSYWPSYGFGFGPGLTYILWRFVPWMLESGVERAAVEDMLIKNPARAFSWSENPIN
jgi:predicted metal-dependent phosphotriesterase family hydrolase